MPLAADIGAIILYFSGCIGIFFWQRRKIVSHKLFYWLIWSTLLITAYTFALEIKTGSFFIVIPASLFALFAFSYFKDKRKLINGWLFNIFLISFGLYWLFVMFEGGSIFLGGLLFIVGTSLLLILIFGVYGLVAFLYWNSIVVLKKESFSLGNLLTLILGIGLTIYLFIQFFVLAHLPFWASVLFTIVPFLMLYFFIVFYNFLTISILYQFNRPKYNQNYVVVLGAGLSGGERVTPLLAKRIDKAIQFYKAQKRATMKPPKLLMSGGQGKDEKIPEAIAMRNYALEQGIPEQDLLIETNSTNTLENMLFSKEIMEQREPQPYKAIFTSNNYHIFRAGLYAKTARLRADGIGARTARYYLPNAFLREFIAIVAMKKKRHLIFCAIIALGILILSLISFLFRNQIDVPVSGMITLIGGKL